PWRLQLLELSAARQQENQAVRSVANPHQLFLDRQEPLCKLPTVAPLPDAVVLKVVAVDCYSAVARIHSLNNRFAVSKAECDSASQTAHRQLKSPCRRDRMRLSTRLRNLRRFGRSVRFCP